MTLPLFIDGPAEARDLPEGTDSKAGTEGDEVNGRGTVSVNVQCTIAWGETRKKGKSFKKRKLNSQVLPVSSWKHLEVSCVKNT